MKRLCFGVEQQDTGGIHTQLGDGLFQYHIQHLVQAKVTGNGNVNGVQRRQVLDLVFNPLFGLFLVGDVVENGGEGDLLVAVDFGNTHRGWKYGAILASSGDFLPFSHFPHGIR